MDNIKDDFYWVNKMKEDFEHILKHTSNKTLKQIEQDDVLLDSIMFRLIQASESSAKITEEFKAQYNNIPWFAIRGLRNRIVHDYGNIDYSIIYATIKNDIVQCVDELNKIILKK